MVYTSWTLIKLIKLKNIEAKKKINLHIYGVHLLNPYKTVVSHLNVKSMSFQDEFSSWV